jgi:hypothetical protein
MAEIRWVDRDAEGKIKGHYARRQRDGQESIPEDHPELIALRTEQEQAETAHRLVDMSRREELDALADWLRTQSRDVLEKFADMQAELDIAKTKWQAEFILLRDWARKKGYPG